MRPAAHLPQAGSPLLHAFSTSALAACEGVPRADPRGGLGAITSGLTRHEEDAMTTLRDDDIQTIPTDGEPLDSSADADGDDSDSTDADADDADSDGTDADDTDGTDGS
jgi:hypothetical protein